MEAYALISDWSPDEAIDVYLRRGDAERALAAAIRDEPLWIEVLSVVPIELDERDVSPN